MAGSNKEMTIVDDGVLEVYELEDSALQECMMFVKKMSETSLTEIEKDRGNLTNLLKEAEKEVRQLKSALKCANSSIDELTSRLQREKEEKKLLQDNLKRADKHVVKLQDCVQERENAAANLKTEIRDLSKSLLVEKGSVSLLHTENGAMKEELKVAQTLVFQNKQRIGLLEDDLRRSCNRFAGLTREYEEKFSQMELELDEERQRTKTAKESSAEEIASLEEKIRKQNMHSKTLSAEADSCIMTMKEQLDEVEKEKAEVTKANQAVTTKLHTCNHELVQLRKELEQERQVSEKLRNDSEERIQELHSRLKDQKMETARLSKIAEEAEKKTAIAETERNKQSIKLKVLEERVKTLDNVPCSANETHISRTRKMSNEVGTHFRFLCYVLLIANNTSKNSRRNRKRKGKMRFSIYNILNIFLNTVLN